MRPPIEAASIRQRNLLPPTLETVVLYDLRHHRETKGHRNSHGPKGEPHGLAPLVGRASQRACGDLVP